MRSPSLLLFCAAFLDVAAADDGWLWTVDKTVISSSTAQISSDVASSIIARRRGLTDSRYLRTTNDITLQEINHYGGWQQPLFGEGAGDAPGKLFIRISGFDGAFSHLGNAPPDLWIDKPTQELKTDFKAEPNPAHGICEYAVPPSANSPNSKDVEVIFTYHLGDEITCLPADEIPSIPVILSLYSVLPTAGDKNTIHSTIGPLTRILRHLSSTQNVETTLVLLPSKLSPSPSMKQSQKELRRRADQAVPEETRLDLPYPTLRPEGYDGLATNSSNTSHPLPSVIPSCFNSMSSCVNTTNACSGHGKCYLAHTSCYKCKCSSTVVRVNDDGSKKTVQWGGGACEKKDISVPFVLFASFGTVMLALVAGAVGMLYSMGSQELPSVLGAGVVGPSARK